MNVNNANDATQKAADATKDVVNNAAETAKEGVNATRKVASEAVDKAHETLDAAQKQINPVIDDLAARAPDLANRSIQFCAGASARALRHNQHAGELTPSYVVAQPGKSMLLAAVAGAAVATALIWGSRSRH